MPADLRHILGRVDSSGGIDSCWPWTGARDRNGYGRISRKTYGDALVHRYLMRHVTGLEPEAWLHECDNPPCCNPLHLTAGTRLANNRQAWGRGLHPQGPDHVFARLSSAQVVEIRGLVSGGVKQADVARSFGICPSHVSRIVNHRVRKAA